MPRDKRHINNRNRMIQEDWKKYEAIKTPKGVHKYTSAYIAEKLSDKYFVSERTIYAVMAMDIPADGEVQMQIPFGD